jgi:hypothetical protein
MLSVVMHIVILLNVVVLSVIVLNIMLCCWAQALTTNIELNKKP